MAALYPSHRAPLWNSRRAFKSSSVEITSCIAETLPGRASYSLPVANATCAGNSRKCQPLLVPALQCFLSIGEVTDNKPNNMQRPRVTGWQRTKYLVSEQGRSNQSSGRYFRVKAGKMVDGEYKCLTCPLGWHKYSMTLAKSNWWHQGPPSWCNHDPADPSRF